ncbi:MAG: hypothetical protein KAS32_19325 [Candidatus Peribacteraceae bacterium]|nr:hypothetical protein [Candidatus Peribacteraceae bacterium]
MPVVNFYNCLIIKADESGYTPEVPDDCFLVTRMGVEDCEELNELFLMKAEVEELGIPFPTTSQGGWSEHTEFNDFSLDVRQVRYHTGPNSEKVYSYVWKAEELKDFIPKYNYGS